MTENEEPKQGDVDPGEREAPHQIEFRHRLAVAHAQLDLEMKAIQMANLGGEISPAQTAQRESQICANRDRAIYDALAVANAGGERDHTRRQSALDQGRQFLHQTLTSVFLVAGAGIAASISYVGEHGAEGWRYFVVSTAWVFLVLTVVAVVVARFMAGASFGFDEDDVEAALKKPSARRSIEKRRRDGESDFECFGRVWSKWNGWAVFAAYALGALGLVFLTVFHIAAVPDPVPPSAELVAPLGDAE